jgi:hypothetical protein
MFNGHSTRPDLTLHLLCTMWILAESNRFEAFEFEQRFFVNPGSATGAWSGLWNGYVCLVKSRMWGKLTLCRDATPSFALLDVQGPVIVTYVYQQVDGEVSAFSRIPFVVHVSCPSPPCRLSFLPAFSSRSPSGRLRCDHTDSRRSKSTRWSTDDQIRPRTKP